MFLVTLVWLLKMFVCSVLFIFSNAKISYKINLNSTDGVDHKLSFHINPSVLASNFLAFHYAGDLVIDMHAICIFPLLCQKCRGCNLAKLHTLGAQTAILGASVNTEGQAQPEQD